MLNVRKSGSGWRGLFSIRSTWYSRSNQANVYLLNTCIRPAGSAVGDQQRVVTPQHAREIGSTYIVVGRPITQAENPYEAYQEIKKTGAESNMTKVAKRLPKIY